MSDYVRKWRCTLYCLCIFAIGMLIVFLPVLPKYAGLVAPDSMPFFAWPWRTPHIENLLAGGTFSPHNLYWLILHPLYAHELTYIIDTLVLTLGAVYYLHTQRLHPLSAWFGGLALGFCGYTFTLFSAGHRGYFHMFSCAIWAFGLIASGFATRRLTPFALLGLVLAWGVSYQPDVLLLVGSLAAAYVLWLTFSNAGVEASSSSQSAIGNGQSASAAPKSKIDNIKSKILTIWPRFLISLVILVLAGFAGVRSAVTTQIANRDAQIAGASGRSSSEESTADMPEKSAAERRERWLFATNWSLPPEDVLEFLVPGVFGNDSAQPPYPYWGRLGRPHDSLFQKGRMMPNYRQHTVYLGLIPLLFAIFAAFSRPGRADARPSPENKTPNSQLPTPKSSFLNPKFSDVPFWCGVWLVCLLLAMGRYTPLYRLFYALPYMDYIRAPVKFLHLVEIATAFLAGFGMELFLRGEQDDKLRRRLVKLACGMAGVLLLGVLVALTARPAIVRHITALGLGQVADALGGYTLRNTVRAAGLALVVAGALWAVVYRIRDDRAPWVLAACLIALLCLDQATVARRYVRPMELGPLYRENAVVKALRSQAGDRTPNVVSYATQNVPGHEWFSSSLAFNGIRNLAPSQDDMSGAYGQLFTALQKDALKLWRRLHAQAVIVPRKNAEGLIRAGVLRPLLDFELGAGTVRSVQQPGEQTLTLAAVVQPVVAPCFITEWMGDIPVERHAETAATSDLPVSDAPRVEGQTGGAAKVEVLTTRGRPGVLATRVRVSAQAPGLLVFDERLRDRQQLLVDGAPVQLYTVDGIWPAALIPAGDHEVVLRTSTQPVALVISICAALIVLGWASSVRRRPVG